ACQPVLSARGREAQSHHRAPDPVSRDGRGWNVVYRGGRESPRHRSQAAGVSPLSRTRHSTGRHRRKHEDHTNHEAWAIPYGDLVTLLLAFFVVMYAISSVNSGKYRVLSDSLFAAFRGTPRTLQPIQVGEKQVGTGADMNSTMMQQNALEGRAQSH